MNVRPRIRSKIIDARLRLLLVRTFPRKVVSTMHGALIEVGEGLLSTTPQDYETYCTYRAWRSMDPWMRKVMVTFTASFVGMYLLGYAREGASK